MLPSACSLLCSLLIYSSFVFASATGVQASPFPQRISSLNFSGLASGLDTSKRLTNNKAVQDLPGENDHLTFQLPDEPPKEKKKKKGKKGKKGSAKKRKKK